MTLPLADELSALHARTSGLLLSEDSVQTAVRLVTELAVETLPGTAGSGVSLLDGPGGRTTGASCALVVDADAVQYELGEGPCVAAWTERLLVRVDDVRADHRWPRWRRAVEPLGLHGVLSAPLVAGDVAMGAIKVYAGRPGAFGARHERLLTMFAAQASIVLAQLRTAAAARRISTDLADALRARDDISTAKGVVMARHGVDARAGLAMLMADAARERKPLHDVARALTRSAVRHRR
jgi:GAF domain-containing protein